MTEMTLEEQVCFEELARKLEELGVKQESSFYWVKIEHTKGYYLALRKEVDGGYEYVFISTKPHSHTSNDIEDVISAFTAAELGKMLNSKYFMSGIYKDMAWARSDNPDIKGHECGHAKLVFMDKSEANARAKMLIWLIENGMLNKRPLYDETDETQNGAYNPRMRY